MEGRKRERAKALQAPFFFVGHDGRKKILKHSFFLSLDHRNEHIFVRLMFVHRFPITIGLKS